MAKCIIAILFVLLTAFNSQAQSKPYGAFDVGNDGLSNGPSESDGRKFKPKVIAAWLFTWRDRWYGIKGGQSMPLVVSWFR